MRKIYLVFALLLTLGKPDYASTILITVEDFEFDPAVITVNVGDTILWIWDEGVHTTTSTLMSVFIIHQWVWSVTSRHWIQPVFLY